MIESAGLIKVDLLGMGMLAVIRETLIILADAFLAALINNQPLGFYPSEVLINEAFRHGVRILPVDVNRSFTRCTIETTDEQLAVRLRMVCVRGVSRNKSQRIENARQSGFFTLIKDFMDRTQLDGMCIEHLILASAFDGLNLPRQALLWQLWILEKWRGGYLLFEPDLTPPTLPKLKAFDWLDREDKAQGFSLPSHPIALLRPQLSSKVRRSNMLKTLRDTTPVRAAGMVICMQRPPTAKGVAFLLLEDEVGLINVVISPSVYEQYRAVFRLAPFVCVWGTLQRRDGVIHIQAQVFQRVESNRL